MKTSKLFLLFLLVAPFPLLAQIRDVQSKQSTNDSVDMEFVLVQPGKFQMGSTDAYADAKPIHSVTISKSFYIGKYEVTQKQWRDIMGTNPSYYQEDNSPVESINWNDAQDFIRKLNEKGGTTRYRLPTEAEWEFAARGGTRSNGYEYAGSDSVAHVTVYSANSGRETKPVGSKRANELGLYDMSGNVWEWCSDWYGAYGGSDERDPKGPASGKYRVLRGGSFNLNDLSCRVANRGSDLPASRTVTVGFRCVRDLD